MEGLQVSNVITWVISVAAFGLASYSLYLQRKDRKPRLNIELVTDVMGSYEESLELSIHASNPTDRPISIESIQFLPVGRELYGGVLVPLGQTISIIPPHEKRVATIVVPQFRQTLGLARTGKFILIDALGNKHKTDAMVL